MRIKSLAAAALIAVAALSGCASSGGDDDNGAAKVGLTEPEVQIIQLSTVAEAARHITGALPVQYRVEVQNPGNEQITLKRVDVQSLGAGAYRLPASSRPFNVVIAPQGTQAVDFWMSGVIDDATVFGANGPVSLRVTANFDSPKGAFNHTFVEQVHFRPTSGQ